MNQQYEKAIFWLHKHSGDGVHVSNLIQKDYPEVTGYLIPTLLEWGEHRLARPECLRAWSRIIWKNRLYRKYPNALAMWLKATLA